MIKQITFNDIPMEIIKDAKREKITFLDDSIYYGYFIDNKIVAISAILHHNKFSVLKSAYILPDFRGKKIYKEMTEFRLNELKNIRVIETRAKKINSPYLQKLGFKLVKSFGIADYLRLVK